MRFVEFAGKPTSVLGFGCGGVLGRVGRRASLQAMAAAWEGGVTLFDTARSYGYGEAEGVLGEFLRGRREQAVVVTKFGIWPERLPAWKRVAKPVVRTGLKLLPGARPLVRRVGVNGTSTPGQFDVKTMRQSLEQSLRALGTDRVEALLMHVPSPEAMEDEALLRALEGVVAEGKVRRVGVSIQPAELEVELHDLLSVVQLPAPVAALNASREVIARLPGAFTMVNHVFGGPEGMARLRENGIAIDDALRAVLQETGADAVVVSMLHEEHVHRNLAAMT